MTSLPTAVRHIDNVHPDVTLATDASHTGWGATPGGNHKQGLWSSSKTRNCPINVLELQAGELGLRTLLHSLTGQHIRIMSDNMTTITYINVVGGCKSQALNRITKRIWLWANDSHHWLSVPHKPGQLNVTADALSRLFENGIEWQLSSHLFGKLCQALGNPQVNLIGLTI